MNSRSITLKDSRSSDIYSLLKAAVEPFLAVILLILLFPIILILILLIKLESPGSAFYSQERVGLHGRKFMLTKLRSMRSDAEASGPQYTVKNDPRVTRVGYFLRQTRLDELPQLLSVIKGEMSLIGPRPERPVFVDQYASQVIGFKNRLQVRPGITGWAQINGGNDVTPFQKYMLDMYYINNRAFLLDLKIAFLTIGVMLSGSGAR